MKKLFKNIILLSLFISPLVFAEDVPVESLTASNSRSSSSSASSNLTADQRLAVLERQISAMNQIDLVNQVNHLEQQVQDLQGQVQVLTHTLQTVQTQTTNQYADLDKRLLTAGENTVSNPAASTTSVNSDDNSEKNLYDLAYKNIKSQKHDTAIMSFKKYLAKYPTGDHAVDAHYWLGQMYILKGDNASVKQAITEFNAVIKKYPDSDKAKESSLKLGFAYLLQNKTKEAKAQFKKVMKDYPDTSTAQLAEARLAQLS